MSYIVSMQLEELVYELLDSALYTLEQQNDFFAYVSIAQDVTYETVDSFEFIDDQSDDPFLQVRTLIQEQHPKAYACCYKGVVIPEGSDIPEEALLVDFWEDGAPSAYSAYVTYKFNGNGEIICSEPRPAGEERIIR